MSLYLGVDPGLSGAYAVMTDAEDVLECEMLPVIELVSGKEQVDIHRLEFMLSAHTFQMAALEQVGVRPGEGPVGAFTFGRTVGRIETILALSNIRCVTPTPQTWKRMVLTASGVVLQSDKESQKAAAIKFIKTRYPAVDLRKNPKCRTDHDGKAEAVCLALYALRYHQASLTNPAAAK
jgi:crossover junction endodeoxyribonuclease RuvC